MQHRHEILVDSEGNLSFIYSDDLRDLLAEGNATVARASHVEPVTTELGVRWNADMTPVNGPASLGEFTTRDAALAAEVKYLQENVLC